MSELKNKTHKNLIAKEPYINNDPLGVVSTTDTGVIQDASGRGGYKELSFNGITEKVLTGNSDYKFYGSSELAENGKSEYTFDGESVLTESDNLWSDNTSYSNTNLGITTTFSGSKFTTSGTTTGGGIFAITTLTNSITFQSGTYTIRCNNHNGNYQVILLGSDFANRFCTILEAQKKTTITKTESYTITRIAFYCSSVETFNDTNVTIEIFNGTEIPSTYTPYFAPYIKNKGVKNEYIPTSKTTNENGQIRYGVELQSGTYTIVNNCGSTFYCRDGVSTTTSTRITSGTTLTTTFINKAIFWGSASYSSGISIVKGNTPMTLPCDNNYYLAFNNTLYNIGTQPLIEGDTWSTNGLRKRVRSNERIENDVIVYDSVNTTEIGQAYELPSGLVDGQNVWNDLAQTRSMAGYNIFLGNIVLPSGTYTFSLKHKNNTATNIYCNLNGFNGDVIKKDYNTTSITFTIESTTNCYFKTYNTQDTSVNDISEIMLNEGSTARAYTQHIADETKLYYIRNKGYKRNQKIDNGNFADTSVWAITNGTRTVSNNEMTLTQTSSSGRLYCVQNKRVNQTGGYILNHIYFQYCEVYQTISSQIYFRTNSSPIWLEQSKIETYEINKWVGISSIFKIVNPNNSEQYQISRDFTNTGESFKIRNAYLIDLTEMFGYGNEPTTVDEVLPYINNDTTNYYINLAGNMINLGTQPLRETDTRCTDGVRNNGRGIVDLGSLNYQKDSKNRFTSDGIKTIINYPSSASVTTNILCAKYESKSANQTYLQNDGISIDTTGVICIYDSDCINMTYDEYKSYISGVYLEYELKNTSTTILDKYDLASGLVKNLLRIIPKEKILNGTNTVSDGKQIAITGTAISSGGRTSAYSEDIILESGTYYLMNFGQNQSRGCLSRRSDGSSVKQGNGSFTLSENTAVYFGINVATGETYNEILKPMLVKGNTEPTTYESFIAEENPLYKFEDFGIKNLFTFNDRTVVTGYYSASTPKPLNGNKLFIGATYNGYVNSENAAYKYETNKLSVKGSGGYGVGFDFKVKPKTTYSLISTVSVKVETIFDYVSFYDDNGNIIGWEFWGHEQIYNLHRFTTPENCGYAMFVFRPSGIESTISDIMVSEGRYETMTFFPYNKTYVKLETGTESYYECVGSDTMKSINNVVDTVAGDKRKIRIKEVNAWELNWNRTEYLGSYLFFANAEGIEKLTNNINCLIYKNTTGSIYQMEDGVITANGGAGLSFWIRDDRFSDVATFKQYLELNKIVIRYALATEQSEDIKPIRIKESD